MMHFLRKWNLFIWVIICFSSLNAADRIVLTQNENLRLMGPDNILLIAYKLKAGSVLEIPDSYILNYAKYKTEQGEIKRTSTGFVSPIKLISAKILSQSDSDEIELTLEQLHQINTRQNYYIIASTIPYTSTRKIPAMGIVQPLSEGYLKYYDLKSRPLFNFTERFMKRFGARLNSPIDPHSLSEAELQKSRALMRELQKVANRTVDTTGELLFTSLSEAKESTETFEKTGAVNPFGSWTIAVKSTAVLHGFPNVPCAEFISEILRAAYARSGISHFEDFSHSLGNELIWSQTASVRVLTNSLFKAGWVPYEMIQFIPPLGAIMMHEIASTPGHVYLSAGADGNLIIDNAAPLGRDLRVLPEDIIELMYKTGLFFLPPGITPERRSTLE